MKVYEAIARAVVREGVRAVFGLMGDGNLKLIPSLTNDFGVPFYGARHEAGSVAMAQGYARVSGAVGVCTFTQGPGLTNALTALISAQRGRTPLVVLCGDTPTAVDGLPQDIDQMPILAAAGIVVEPFEPARAGAAVAAAFGRARREHRPVALVLPTDLQDHECAWSENHVETTAPVLVMPDPSELDAAAAALRGARRPVLLAGRGALEAAAREELLRLAAAAGALLATTLPVKDWFTGETFDVGVAGGFADGAARRLIGEADCVFAFGAGLNHFTTRGGTLFSSDATVIQCDVDPGAFGRYRPVDVAVLGDAALVAGGVTQRLTSQQGYRTPDVARLIAESAVQHPTDESEPERLDPRTLSRVAAAALPADRTLAVDGGHFMGFPSMAIRVQDPSQFVFTLDFGSIGLGLAAGVGAAIGRPESVTVVAVGDGGLMMNLGELDTAIRYRLPLVVLVYDDGAYGAEMHFLRMLGLPDAESLFETPPIAELARVMGADSARVATVEALEKALGGAQRLDRPLVLDCKVTTRVRAEWLAEAFERGHSSPAAEV